MHLGYFTVNLDLVDLALTPKDIKSLCESLAKRFHVLARHKAGLLVVAALKGTEHELTQVFEEAAGYLEQKIGRIETSDYCIEPIHTDSFEL